jgi:hypothetical protein
VTAGLAGLAYLISDTLIPKLGEMKKTAIDAFGGIAKALKAGDLELAGQIFWATLKVEWLTGVDYLKGIWSDFIVFAMDALGELGSAQRRLWVDVRTFALDTLGRLAGEGAPARKARHEAAATEIAGIDEQQRNAEDMRRANNAQSKERADRQAELGAAQDELDALLGQADEAGMPGAPEDMTTWRPGKGAAAAAAPAAAADIQAGVSAAARKVDVAGTFNARALGGLSAGESVSSQLSEQIDLGKKQLEEQKKTNDRLKKAQIAFSA